MKCRTKKWAKNDPALDFWIRFSAISIKKMSIFHWPCNKKSKILSKIGTHTMFFSSESWDIILSKCNKWGPRDRYFGVKNRLHSENEVKNRALSTLWEYGPPFRPPIKYQEIDPTIVSLWKRLWMHFQAHPQLQILEKHDFSRFLGLWGHFRPP